MNGIRAPRVVVGGSKEQTGPGRLSIESGRWEDYQPLTILEASGPIEFLVPRSGDNYLDLSSVRLYMKADVVKANDTDFDTDNSVAPVNNWLHSLFNQVDVSTNDMLVIPSTNTYPYRAYTETLFSYGTEDARRVRPVV